MADVVVIGGGIVGASVTYHAARAGLSVTLIDRADEGFATAAGAGIIAPGAGDGMPDPHHVLVDQAARHYPVLIDWLAGDGETDTGYAVVGSLKTAFSGADLPELTAARQFAETARAAGTPGIGEIELLDSAAARAKFPALGEVHAALWFAGTARLDGRLMRSALLRAAQRRGATVLQGNATLALDANGAPRVSVDGLTLTADRVVLAAGAWTSTFGSALGLRLPVAPQRGQIVHLALPDTDTSRWPVILTTAGHYLLTFPPDRVVVGATREPNAGWDYRLTAAGVHQVLGQALEVAPGLGQATVRETRIGFRPASPDGLPLLGPAPASPRVLIAAGHGAHGLTLGPHAGAAITNMLLGEPAGFDLQPYAVDRFGAI